MADLKFTGTLDLSGTLRLSASTGKVKAGDREMLLENITATGIPVIQPPPPGTPIDNGPTVKLKSSFNTSITIGGKNVVAQGITLQGDKEIWPGIVLPSTSNQTVTINRIPINVLGDQAMTLPNGGSASFSSTSGQ
jgi:hypothetical protein